LLSYRNDFSRCENTQRSEGGPYPEVSRAAQEFTLCRGVVQQRRRADRDIGCDEVQFDRVENRMENRQAAVARAMRTMAARLRFTSLDVVAQEDTLMRIAVLPCHTVPLHQQVPSSCMRRITS
jgi:hypothetical protein